MLQSSFATDTQQIHRRVQRHTCCCSLLCFSASFHSSAACCLYAPLQLQVKNVSKFRDALRRLLTPRNVLLRPQYQTPVVESLQPSTLVATAVLQLVGVQLQALDTALPPQALVLALVQAMVHLAQPAQALVQDMVPALVQELVEDMVHQATLAAALAAGPSPRFPFVADLTWIG